MAFRSQHAPGVARDRNEILPTEVSSFLAVNEAPQLATNRAQRKRQYRFRDGFPISTCARGCTGSQRDSANRGQQFFGGKRSPAVGDESSTTQTSISLPRWLSDLNMRQGLHGIATRFCQPRSAVFWR